MTMRRCENGHYYDTSNHSACPLCLDFAKADALNGQTQNPQVLELAAARKPRDTGAVVGWFVCVKGSHRGADYRIKNGKNFISRSALDVRISGEALTHDEQAIVEFDEKNNVFTVEPGQKNGFTYLNGEKIAAPRTIKMGDKLDLGETTLLFVPLCGESFDWERA